MPTHVSVRSSSRLSRSQSILASGTSGLARCAATATMPTLSTANRTAQAIAVPITAGRLSQSCDPSRLTWNACGTARWNVADAAAPASPSAAELNTRRYIGIRRARR